MKKRGLALIMGSFLLVSCGNGSGDSGESSGLALKNEEQSQVLPSFEKYAGSFKTIDYSNEILNPSDLRYNSAIVTRDKTITKKNHQIFTKGLRTVRLYGKKIVLNKDNAQGFYRLINKASDIEQLSIHAEHIVVSDVIHIPGADVELKAKRISFEGEGKIDTTPLSLDYKANQFVDGKDGLKGGDITVIAEEVIQDMQGVRFVANGGDGQDAGPGQDGGRGHNAVIVRAPNYYRYDYKINTRPPMGPVFKSAQNTEMARASGRPAGNGGNAKVGGRPGAPGDAGNIQTVISLPTNSILQVAGKVGKKDIKRIGGAPGTPIKSCAFKGNNQGLSKVYNCVTAVKGHDVNPKEAAKQTAEDGVVIWNSSFGRWITDSYVKAQLQFAKDVYAAGNAYYAKNLLNELESNISKNNEREWLLPRPLPSLSLCKSE